MSQRPKSICLYCGSRLGNNPSYKEAATQLGEMLAKLDIRLVYGAGDTGLMGTTATAAQKSNGNIFGVIPTHLMKREIGKRDISTFVITENMHERKKVMALNADAFIMLPGGLGSLDEFFEIITWRQLGLHDKPIYLLNIDGYWDSLLSLIEHIISEGFAERTCIDYFQIFSSVAELQEHLS